MRVTEITGVEEVMDGETFLYVEYLVATWDRDERDIPAQRLIGTEVVRVKADNSAEFVNPITGERIDAKPIPSTTVDGMVSQIITAVDVRMQNKESRSKWRAERFSNLSR